MAEKGTARSARPCNTGQVPAASGRSSYLMREDGRARLRRLLTPASLWVVAVAVAVGLALALGLSATTMTLHALEPIGEGELLAAETQEAAARILQVDSAAAEDELRHIRNSLDVEAVSLVAPDGAVMRSTSGTLERTRVDPLLASSLAEARFAALAGPLPMRVEVDGVVEWEAGDVLYQALQPLGDGTGIMLSFDVSELLERRAEATAIPPQAIALAIGSGVFLLLAGLLHAARIKAAQTRRLMEIEADHLRQRADELEHHNAELEAARMETQRALDLAEEKNRIRAEFVLMINHELRTPLTGVVTGARLIAGSPNLDGSERDLLDDVIADGERLDALLSQMLAVARAENRGLTAQPVQQSLADVVERLDRAHRAAKTSMTEGLGLDPIDVHTDATTLAQLVASLVDNAYTHGATRVKIMVTDSIPARVHHEIGHRPKDAVYVAVVDDGPGIDPEFLPRAFEKFEKQSFSSGTGLGLYLARMMVESIGASLSVLTSPKGTVMAIGIPARVRERAA